MSDIDEVELARTMLNAIDRAIDDLMTTVSKQYPMHSISTIKPNVIVINSTWYLRDELEGTRRNDRIKH